MQILRILILEFIFVVFGLSANSQNGTDATPADSSNLSFFSLKPAPSFDKKRFWVSAGTGGALYTGASVAMWHAWYKDYPISGFHTFNDMKEWRGMDKAGHFMAAYVQSNYSFLGAQWTGIDRRKAMWAGAGVAFGIQTTVEIMDGFSEEWGFSVGDLAFNTLGASLFVCQEMAWKEQRILLKVSSTRPHYDTDPIYSVDGSKATSLKARASELYGNAPTNSFLKDYNAMTVWASFNPKSFMHNKEGKFPAWVNVAVGVGAGNVYGGFDNTWTDDTGAVFRLDDWAYPRHQQFYLAPDIDLSRIPTRHRWLKLTLSILNWIKVPSPALEVNTNGEVDFYPFYW